MIFPLILSLLSAADAVPASPQAPSAAGPVESIFEVLHAAKACHINELRVSLYPSEKDQARLYLLQDPQDVPVKCLDRWLTENGRRLHLEPRWWSDDFTKDHG